jgi:hypothetical protein
MFELLIRILCDIQPATATNGTFLFGQTEDNDASVLNKVQQLLASNRLILPCLWIRLLPTDIPALKCLEAEFT